MQRWTQANPLGCFARMLAAGVLLAAVSGGVAENEPAQPEQQKVTVAVLDFTADLPAEPDLGKNLGEIIASGLSGQPGFQFVERAALTRALQEQELALSGIVDSRQSVQVGRVVGAQLLITGRVIPLDEELVLTAKLIGVETTRVEMVQARGSAGELGRLVLELLDKLRPKLGEAGPKLIAGETPDPLPRLRDALAGRQLPTIAVIIPEEHLVRWPAAVPDPAVETEIKLLLRACGFKVPDVPRDRLLAFARGGGRDGGNAWPESLDGVDFVVTGEAFSEAGARVGNLVSAGGRAEIALIQREPRAIRLADRETCRAVDLAEHLAGKTALQQCGRELGLRILATLAQQQSREAGR